MGRELVKSSTAGGSGGSLWSDNVSEVAAIQSISICAGDQVDSIQTTYRRKDGSTFTSSRHGGGGGHLTKIDFGECEFIYRIEVKTDFELVNQLTFKTKNDQGAEKSYGPYGNTGLTSFAFDGYVVGFYGRAGNLLETLGVFHFPPLEKSSKTLGGSGGHAFDDDVNNILPPVVGISKLVIRAGNQIDSIQAVYRQLGGGLYEAPRHGGTGGGSNTVLLGENELIGHVEGRTNGVLVDQLTLKSSSKMYGPFGWTGQTHYHFDDGKIMGFFGRAGNLLDRLGFYYAK